MARTTGMEAGSRCKYPPKVKVGETQEASVTVEFGECGFTRTEGGTWLSRKGDTAQQAHKRRKVKGGMRSGAQDCFHTRPQGPLKIRFKAQCTRKKNTEDGKVQWFNSYFTFSSIGRQIKVRSRSAVQLIEHLPSAHEAPSWPLNTAEYMDKF